MKLRSAYMVYKHIVYLLCFNGGNHIDIDDGGESVLYIIRTYPIEKITQKF